MNQHSHPDVHRSVFNCPRCGISIIVVPGVTDQQGQDPITHHMAVHEALDAYLLAEQAEADAWFDEIVNFDNDQT